MTYVLLRLTIVQAKAARFACTNALAEPANFEAGTGNEHLTAPMQRVLDKIDEAIDEKKVQPWP